jgi:hypothetical protein
MTVNFLMEQTMLALAFEIPTGMCSHQLQQRRWDVTLNHLANLTLYQGDRLKRLFVGLRLCWQPVPAAQLHRASAVHHCTAIVDCLLDHGVFIGLSTTLPLTFLLQYA